MQMYAPELWDAPAVPPTARTLWTVSPLLKVTGPLGLCLAHASSLSGTPGLPRAAPHHFMYF